MKFIAPTTFFAAVVVTATVSPVFVHSNEESNGSIGIVGRDEKNFELLWQPSHQEEHGSFTDIDTISRCADEKYELKLVVQAQPHGFVITIPMDDEIKCPSLLWHATWGDPAKKDRLEKSVHSCKDSTMLERDMKLVETMSIGNYFLKEIAEAFHNADDGNDKPYNSVTNNCSLLLINMGKSLGVDYYSHPELIGYVQRHMVDEDGSNMMKARRMLFWDKNRKKN